LRREILDWYDGSRRDLPWRRTRDPYAIWLSETMLQQTRVETVIPYYERFLERFPDLRTLADAPLEEVYACWAGLGYYSRARNLQAAARAVVERFGGELPADASLLRELPGIGRYTAGAVASIAFDRPEPVLDGNVERVLARRLGIRGDVRARESAERLWREAAALADGPRPGDLNQALMELGATLCLPRTPRCDACPVAVGCAARRAGDAEAIPRKPPRAPARRVRAAAALLSRRGRLLLVRRPAGGLLGGLWQLPSVELGQPETPGPAPALQEHLRQALGLGTGPLSPVGSVRHLFTHRALTLELYRGEAAAGRVRLDGYQEHRWLAPAALAALRTSTLTRKALAFGPGREQRPSAQRRRRAP